MGISENLEEIGKQISCNAEIVAAVKTRSTAEILEAINAGINIIGENTVQEAEKNYNEMDEASRNKAEWHMIGHLQGNKVKRAVQIFSCIQSVDSAEIAKEIDKKCKNIGKIMPVLLEINIAEEKTKYGFMPEITNIENALNEISLLENICPAGFMVIEPFFENPENARVYFKKAKNLFDELKHNFGQLRILSMGMSNSYKVAVEEGSTMIRIGTALFGKREPKKFL